MTTSLEHALHGISQLFLLPVLLAIGLLFAYAFVALGACAVQAWQRHRGQAAGFELRHAGRQPPPPSPAALELLALKRLEPVRIATRVAPMLGLVATMIPMGPALQAMAGGQMAEVAQGLTVAFSAVILALIAAAITYSVAQVRRRWYASDLLWLQSGEPQAEPAGTPVKEASA
ncbi:MotA/TolQ/ExbB proton channel family protein [Ideonella livida]|uniref:MotA/TolQ/ExbB proton channel family protein n=1 Tax=Ideonella livida TaxID=2707176 RepID=A0A7C9PER1_9BURK|nr:MotA/TolQ/ExbB proton channel family protein [Ideonella livida]NDY89849.1 MotA/TolQ/ExbB proton channel family protein [Ideonella livida]